MDRIAFIKSLQKRADELDRSGDFCKADCIDKLLKTAHYLPDYRWVDVKAQDYPIGWAVMMDKFRGGEVSGAREASEEMQRVDTLGDKYDLKDLRNELDKWEEYLPKVHK